MSETTKKQVTIDGKDYDFDSLPLDIRNSIIARQEIQTSKARHEVELEKITVLTDYYNKKIKEGIDKINGSDSKSDN